MNRRPLLDSLLAQLGQTAAEMRAAELVGDEPRKQRLLRHHARLLQQAVRELRDLLQDEANRELLTSKERDLLRDSAIALAHIAEQGEAILAESDDADDG